MGSKWLYNSCYVGCCFQDLFMHVASLCSSHLAFSLGVLLKSKWCNQAVAVLVLLYGCITWTLLKNIFKTGKKSANVPFLNFLTTLGFFLLIFVSSKSLLKFLIAVQFKFFFLHNNNVSYLKNLTANFSFYHY